MTSGTATKPGAARSGAVAAPASGTALLLRGVMESLLLLLLLLALEAMFFGHGTFASITPHPFWIVVLAATVQNGLFAGVITAGLAALMMDWPPRPIGTDITEHYLAVAMLPMQWVLAALFIGLFRHGELRAGRRMAAENARLSEASEILAAEVERLDGIIREMELETVATPGRKPVLTLLSEVPAARPEPVRPAGAPGGPDTPGNRPRGMPPRRGRGMPDE